MEGNQTHSKNNRRPNDVGRSDGSTKAATPRQKALFAGVVVCVLAAGIYQFSKGFSSTDGSASAKGKNGKNAAFRKATAAEKAKAEQMIEDAEKAFKESLSPEDAARIEAAQKRSGGK